MKFINDCYKKDYHEFKKELKQNHKPITLCALNYAERWANLMELEMGKGRELSSIQEKVSHEADNSKHGSISRTMFRYARNTLIEI